MADNMVPMVPVHLDRERTMRGDLRAFRRFRELTREAGFGPPGEDPPKGLSITRGDLGPYGGVDELLLPFFLLAFLEWEDPDLTVEALEGMVHFRNWTHVMDAYEEMILSVLPEVEPDIPKGFPHRKELLEAGIKTLDQVALIGDASKVKGIGKAGAERVAQALAKLLDDEEGGEGDDPPLDAGEETTVA